MPEIITLADGTEREVPTDEELKNLQAGHDANITKRDTVKEFNQLKESIGLQEGESIQDRIEDMKVSANPNIREMRNTIKTLKKAAKEKGVEVDDDGNVVEQNRSLTAEEVKQLSSQTYEERQVAAQKEKVLMGYGDKESKEIERVFDKLSKLGGSFRENMDLAINTVLPGATTNKVKEVNSFAGGGGPRQAKPREASDELKSLGSKFGLTADDFKN